MEFTVNKEWLVQQLENKLVKVVDCRFDTSDAAKGRQDYEQHHIPGAVFFDMENDLSGPVEKHGGRHPLPDLTTFQQKLEDAGISNETTVVAYDSGTCEYAARFWWMLSYLGHDRAFVLDGGYQDWLACEFPASTAIPKPKPATFQVNLQEDMLADYEEVKTVSEGEGADAVLIDSRSEERYRGEVEPIDPIPGRIPGAVNYPWERVLQNGSFKNDKVLKERFANLNPEAPVIVYCGSGITATPNYLALKAAGFQNVKLYAGSYSDWISHEGSKVEKG